KMRSILNQFEGLDHQVILAIHPRTKARLAQYHIDTASFTNINFIDPTGYVDSISYQAYAEAIITDSGGMQKEAYMLKKKCITLRSETEWSDTLLNGWNTLVFDDLDILPSIIKQQPGEYIDEL